MKMRRIAALLMALLLLMTFAACGKQEEEEPQQPQEPVEQGPAEYPVELRGTIILEEPDGVVSLSPALTELMQEMGMGGMLEGVSDYCDPSNLPRCGTPQNIDFEEIRASGADLVVTTAALAEDDTTKLLQMNIDVLVLPRAGSLKELEELYVDLGRAVMGEVSGRQKAEDLWENFAARMESLAQRGDEFVDSQESVPTVIFLRMLDYTMATGDTFEHQLLKEMGFKNLAEAYGDWSFPKDNAAQLTPTLIISDDAITIPVLEQNAVYKGTQAVIKDQVVTVDSQAFERQTPRLLDELERVADFLFDGVVEARSAETANESI
ncbi:MAG: ABC transporter substrate-binding protein [Oscillospiraceae bacterium]|nr:ABC transporter substrate-binding protein [Oscillospiraceae bacterium]